ncbi:hypothetical protein [Tengunoibacter tsumagoiensis]|uniref:Uncharacterized protein n=1 Tax=Tengunoibacter tsumagoiensis TaxID=2014871 RepID=A0A402A532_9CHLR|nr:hypothetical protein [Tengunoibacter tsumagoiensis]GCE14212.1 hypothetical protein KTT_40710 [Tengunoibacter tsumagoiensis]GCE14266.1 hypothetical protein KTT_41250 [Tengunoibacter tsumagoiensis]
MRRPDTTEINLLAIKVAMKSSQSAQPALSARQMAYAIFMAAMEFYCANPSITMPGEVRATIAAAYNEAISGDGKFHCIFCFSVVIAASEAGKDPQVSQVLAGIRADLDAILCNAMA